MSLVVPSDKYGRPAAIRVKRASDRRSASRSATRAIDLLEYLGSVRRPVRAVEVAQALSMHPSTTNQLLKTMVDSSHLLFDARTRTYLPSPRLTGFCSWLIGLYGPEEKLRTLVQDLGGRIAKFVTVSTANDIFMQILEAYAPDDTNNHRGHRVSLFGSAVGSAYLSMLDEQEIVWLADRARVSKEETRRALDAIGMIRNDGFASGPSVFAGLIDEDPTWSIAIPLKCETMPLKLVLGVAGSGDEVERQLQDLRREMEDAISRVIL